MINLIDRSGVLSELYLLVFKRRAGNIENHELFLSRRRSTIKSAK